MVSAGDQRVSLAEPGGGDHPSQQKGNWRAVKRNLLLLPGGAGEGSAGSRVRSRQLGDRGEVFPGCQRGAEVKRGSVLSSVDCRWF